MRAVLAYALSRVSARFVMVLGVGGLVFVVYRALHRDGPLPELNLGGTRAFYFPPMSSSWDIAIASLGVLLAIAAAVALYRRLAIRR
jgi:hypothetical protein